MQNEKESSLAGSSSATQPASQPSCDGCPQLAMMRLAEAIAEQNQALWALIEQTAALIEMAVQSNEDDVDHATRYLDGSRVL